MFHGVILGKILPQAKRKLHEMLTKLCRQEKIRSSAASINGFFRRVRWMEVLGGDIYVHKLG